MSSSDSSGAAVLSPSNNKKIDTVDKSTTSVSLSELGGAYGMLATLKAMPFYENQLKHIQVIPPRQAVYDDLPAALFLPAIHANDPQIVMDEVQRLLKIKRFYEHSTTLPPSNPPLTSP